ncbi:MAG: YjbH domain-containing protein, partial [Bacteroidota bacterium]
NGLIYTPSAYLNPWKTIDLGFTHFSQSTSFTYLAGEKSERAFIANLIFLPRVAFSARITRPYDNLRPDFQSGSGRPRNWGIGDRSYGMRVQVLQEKKQQPALVIGLNDPLANLAYFHNVYAVASKQITVRSVHFTGNIGYGVHIEDTRSEYLEGIFGGITATYKGMSVLAEYDSQRLNVGLNYGFRDFIFINLAMIEAQHFSGNVSFRLQLN